MHITTLRRSAYKARDHIFDTVFADVGFADLTSRANAMALLLLPAVRHLIFGPTPLHFITSPGQDHTGHATGKTYLARLCMVPYAIEAPLARCRPSDLQYALAGLPSHVFLDNINRKQLDSGALGNAFTENQISYRDIGCDATLTLPINCVWIATSRDWPGRDCRARMLPINLAPTGTFTGDVLAVLRHSPVALADVRASITAIVRHWMMRGEPPCEYSKTTRFPDWEHIMRDLLASAEVDDFIHAH